MTKITLKCITSIFIGSMSASSCLKTCFYCCGQPEPAPSGMAQQGGNPESIPNLEVLSDANRELDNAAQTGSQQRSAVTGALDNTNQTGNSNSQQPAPSRTIPAQQGSNPVQTGSQKGSNHNKALDNVTPKLSSSVSEKRNPVQAAAKGRSIPENLAAKATVSRTQTSPVTVQPQQSPRMKPINISDCAYKVVFANDQLTEARPVDSNADGFAIVTEGNDHKLIKIEARGSDCLTDYVPIKTITQEEYDAIGTELETEFDGSTFNDPAESSSYELDSEPKNGDVTRVIVEEAGQFKLKNVVKIADKRFVPVFGSTDKVIDSETLNIIASTCFRDCFNDVMKIISDLSGPESKLAKELKQIDSSLSLPQVNFTFEYSLDDIETLLDSKINREFLKSMLKVPNVQRAKSRLDLLYNYTNTCAQILKLRQQTDEYDDYLSSKTEFQTQDEIDAVSDFQEAYGNFYKKYCKIGSKDRLEPNAVSKLEESYEDLSHGLMDKPQEVLEEIKKVNYIGNYLWKRISERIEQSS